MTPVDLRHREGVLLFGPELDDALLGVTPVGLLDVAVYCQVGLIDDLVFKCGWSEPAAAAAADKVQLLPFHDRPLLVRARRFTGITDSRLGHPGNPPNL